MKKQKKSVAKEVKENSERIEALIRIVVFIVSGTILLVWRLFIYILIILNLIYTVIFGKRLRDLADIAEVWNTQWYVFQRYIIFLNNTRPFPFGKLQRKISRYEAN